MSMSGPREFTSSSEAWKHLRKKAATTKAQELREKFAKDTQKIRDRNKGTTEDPSPSTCPGLSDLLQQGSSAKLESNRQVQMLLKYLTTATASDDDIDIEIDISSAYFACKSLLDNLEKIRMEKHLPQVFGTLRKSHYLEYIQDPKNEEEHTNNAVLNLRLVSKSWKEAADAQFLGPVGFSQPDWHLKRDNCNSMLVASPFKCKFEKVEDVESAMKALGSKSSSSLSSSSLLRIVDIEPLWDYDKRFFLKLFQFLDLHGEDVWALHFAGEYDHEIIGNLVSRMPNLKELFLNYLDGWAETDDDLSETAKPYYPFPSVPSLTRIIFAFFPECKSLTREILQRNSSVKTISIADDNPSELHQLYSPLAGLKQLECLDLNILNLGQDMYSLFPEALPLEQMNWPLKVFNLSLFDRGFNPQIVSTGKVFGILNQFHETLEEIDLEALALKDNHDGSSWVVQEFPKLKIIKNVVGLCSLL